MVEPVGVTLGALGLILPLYEAANSVYKGIQVTRRFGLDFAVVQVELQIQFFRLSTSVTRLKPSADQTIASDSSGEVQQLVIRCIEVLKTRFQQCYQLTRRYADDGKSKAKAIPVWESLIHYRKATEDRKRTSQNLLRLLRLRYLFGRLVE